MRKITATLLMLLGVSFASANTNETMPGFVEINAKAIEGNYAKIMSQQWALVSAGTQDHFNTMTIAWGTFGNLWQRPVAIIYVSPKRYTHSFIEREDRVTITLFSGAHKEDMKYLGTHSGRDGDKLSNTSLKVCYTPSGLPTFEQATLIIEGRKIYKSRFEAENFIDDAIRAKVYKNGDPDSYHDAYVLEIERVWKRSK